MLVGAPSLLPLFVIRQGLLLLGKEPEDLKAVFTDVAIRQKRHILVADQFALYGIRHQHIEADAVDVQRHPVDAEGSDGTSQECEHG